MNTAVIIHSCDKYNYILPDFFKHFNRFRPDLEKLGLPIWLTTEEIDSSALCANIITGKAAWSTRLKLAIHTLAPTIEHIILIQEDFFFTHVDTKAVSEAIDFHVKKHGHITKLGSFYEFNMSPLFSRLECGCPVFIQSGGHYTMSHQPVAIFERNFLLRTLEKHRDPWEHECDVTKEINNNDYGQVNIYTIGNIFNPNKSEIMTSHHAMRKGVYYPL